MDSHDIDSDMPKDIKCYKIGTFLYSYRNYNVYTGINSLTKEEVIIKALNKKYINGNSKLLTFVNNEILYTKIFSHNNILKLLETHESPLYIFIIMENFKGELLSSYMNKNKKLEESKALKIFSKIISAMIYIHNMNICHLNINLDSILIDENDENLIKIFDFKYGKYYYAKFKTLSDNIGTNMFTAPEMFSIDSYYPELVDVWSCGILLCYLLTGDFPINSNKELDIDERYVIPNDLNEDLQDLLKNILCIDIDQRYRFDDIVNSKYFKDNNYTNEIMEENNDNFSIDDANLKKIYERYQRTKVNLGREDNKNCLINFEIIIHRELLPDNKRMSKLIEMFGRKVVENTGILPKKNNVKNNKKKSKENNNIVNVNNNLITKDSSFPIKKKDTFTDFKFNKNKIMSNEINKGNSNKKKGVKGKRKSVFEFYNSRFPQKSYLFEIPENISEKEEIKFLNQKKENESKNENVERKYLKKNTKIENNPKFVGQKITSSSVGRRRKTQFAVVGEKYADFNMFSQIIKKKKIKIEEKKEINIDNNKKSDKIENKNEKENNDLNSNINNNDNIIKNEIKNNNNIDSNTNNNNDNNIKNEIEEKKANENKNEVKINEIENNNKPLFDFEDLYEDIEVSDKEEDSNKIIEENEKENDINTENNEEIKVNNDNNNENINNSNSFLGNNSENKDSNSNLGNSEDTKKRKDLEANNLKTKSDNFKNDIKNIKIKNGNQKVNDKNNHNKLIINAKLKKEDYLTNYQSKTPINQNYKNDNNTINNFIKKKVTFKDNFINSKNGRNQSPSFYSKKENNEDNKEMGYYTARFFSYLKNKENESDEEEDEDKDEDKDEKSKLNNIQKQKNGKQKNKEEKVVIKKFVNKTKTPNNRGILKRRSIFETYKKEKKDDKLINDDKSIINNNNIIEFNLEGKDKKNKNRKNSMYEVILQNLKDLNKSFEKNEQSDIYLNYMRRKITPDKFKNKKKIENSSSNSSSSKSDKNDSENNSKSKSDSDNNSESEKDKSSQNNVESSNNNYSENYNNYNNIKNNKRINDLMKHNEKNKEKIRMKKNINNIIKKKIISNLKNKTNKTNKIDIKTNKKSESDSISEFNSSYYSNSININIGKNENNKNNNKNKDILKDVDNFNFINNEYNSIKSKMNKNATNNYENKINSKIFSKSSEGRKQKEKEIELSSEDKNKNNLNNSKEYIGKVKKNLRERLISVSSDLSEEKVKIFNGNVIDLKYISLKNYEQTVNVLINELKRKGVKFKKIDYNSYKCTKGIREFYVDIVKIPKNIFYYRFYNKKKQINNFH